jgi:serine protease Do
MTMKTIGVMTLALSASFAQQAPQPPQPPRARSAGMQGQSVSYLGVGIMSVDTASAKALRMKEERGAEITQIAPGGPAEKAGLKVNDVILEFDGQHVQGQDQLQRLVRESIPGHQVKVDVWRNGAMQTVTVTIESHREISPDDPFGRGIWSELPPPGVNWPQIAPMPPMPPFPTIVQSPILGVECEPLGDEQQFAEFFGVKDGLLVKMVASGSPAARAGIKAGDVIVKVDETRVGTMRELTGALRVASQKNTYQLTVVRSKKEMQITAPSQ